MWSHDHPSRISSEPWRFYQSPKHLLGSPVCLVLHTTEIGWTVTWDVSFPREGRNSFLPKILILFWGMLKSYCTYWYTYKYKIVKFQVQGTVFYNCFSYQELYQSCVTKLTKPECIYTQSRGGEEEPKVDNNTSLNSSTRKLPSWMLGKEEATPTKLSLDRTDSSSSTDGLGRYL